ncbi:unnamed protein product, partial [Timema podura]|nr:unnamed protein product [Timema podura]
MCGNIITVSTDNVPNSEFLGSNLSYDEVLAVNVVGQTGLWEVLQFLASYRGLHKEVLDVLGKLLRTHIATFNTKESEDTGFKLDKWVPLLEPGLWIFISEPSLLQAMLVKAPDFRTHLRFVELCLTHLQLFALQVTQCTQILRIGLDLQVLHSLSAATLFIHVYAIILLVIWVTLYQTRCSITPLFGMEMLVERNTSLSIDVQRLAAFYDPSSPLLRPNLRRMFKSPCRRLHSTSLLNSLNTDTVDEFIVPMEETIQMFLLVLLYLNKRQSTIHVYDPSLMDRIQITQENDELDLIWMIVKIFVLIAANTAILVENVRYLGAELTYFHNSIHGGHLDILKTFRKKSKEFFWPDIIYHNVKGSVSRCEDCQKAKPDQNSKVWLHSADVARFPWGKNKWDQELDFLDLAFNYAYHESTGASWTSVLWINHCLLTIWNIDHLLEDSGDKLDISTSTTLSLETKIKDMEYRLEESSSRNRSFETQLGDLQLANDDLTSRVGQYTATQQDLEQEISQLKSQLQDKSHELEDLQSNHTSETENLKSVIQSRWDEIQKVASDLKEVTDVRIGMEEQLVEKNDLIRNLQEEIDNLKMQTEMKEHKMSELTKISEVQREEKTGIENLLSAKSEEIMKLSKDLEDARTEQEEWKVKFEKLEIEMAKQNDKNSHEWENKWKAAIKEKDQAVIESQLMVDKIKKDVEVRLQSELDKLNKIKEDVLQSSTKEIGDIVNEKDTIIEELKEIIKKEKESKENEVMILKKELENVTSSRSEEINKLKSDMKVLQQEKSEYIQKAKKELEDNKAESSAKLKSRFPGPRLRRPMDIMRLMTIEDKELRSQLVLKDKEISSFQSNLASNEKEVRALTEKVAELGKNNKDLTLEKKHQEELNKNMKEELNHLMKKINRLEENNLIGVAKPIASSTPIINHGSSATESALKINKGKESGSPVQFDDLSSRSILKSPLESLSNRNDHSKKKVVFDISENENSDASIDISTLRPRNRKRFNKTKFSEKDGSYPVKK